MRIPAEQQQDCQHAYSNQWRAQRTVWFVCHHRLQLRERRDRDGRPGQRHDPDREVREKRGR